MSSRRPGRFVPNPFAGRPAPAPMPPPSKLIDEFVRAAAECAAASAVPRCTGQYRRDLSLYTGLSGLAYTQLRLAMHVQRQEAAAGEAMLREAKRLALQCIRLEPSFNTVSFFCGTPGPLALACVASHMLGESAEAGARFSELLRFSVPAREHSEDELLFGRAGYLHAVQWAAAFLAPEPRHADVLAAGWREVQPIAEMLVDRGVHIAREGGFAAKGWPMIYRCFGDPYLGAAHGVVGVLAVLFRSYKLLSPASRAVCQQTLAQLLEERLPSGNLPIMVGAASDEHVHWCHGAPGVVAMLTAAIEAIGDQDGALIAAARQATEVVWNRGVILKGNGLCHGLAGNGYAFLSLMRVEQDEHARHELLARARCFRALMSEPELQRVIARQPDPQRRCVGKPDAPLSLMEGMAGELCYYLDMSAADDGRAPLGFPGWDDFPYDRRTP